jgi:hypothetical protein
MTTTTAAVPGPAPGGQQPAPDKVMSVYALHEPIDFFDDLVPLPEWITADPDPRTRWTLQAVLALADTAAHMRWDGDMRHLPSIGAIPTPTGIHPYLVIKQDNNGTTFVISSAEVPWPHEQVEHAAHIDTRAISDWTHPTLADIEADTHPAPQPDDLARQPPPF